MDNESYLALRDLRFAVAEATLVFARGWIEIEIETEALRHDGELWKPRLYHQGFQIPTTHVPDLAGVRVRVPGMGDAAAEGAEFPFLYVFGHESVRKSFIEFGRPDQGSVLISWAGIADVCWDEPYGDDVPFKCVCRASLVER